MGVPAVQIAYNDEEIKVFWNEDTSGTYAFFNLYYLTDEGEDIIATNIPNVPDGYYSNKHITYKFKRSSISLTIDDSFYIILKGVTADEGEDTGPTRYIPSIPEQLSNFRGVQIHGYDYTGMMWRKVGVNSDGTLSS
jgi:hypothetical protein